MILKQESLKKNGGAETGSTRAVKAKSGVRHGIRRYRARQSNANDNYVVANDNSAAGEAVAA